MPVLKNLRAADFAAPLFLKLSGLEILLAYTANRAYPILRDILESCAGCDSAIGITDFGVIFIAA